MTNLNISPLIIGTMRLGKWGINMTTSDLQAFVEGCLEMGLNDFDHADIYGDYTEEANFGKILKTNPKLREDIQITTKCGIKMKVDSRLHHEIKSYDAGRSHIIASVEQSLINLNTDYIDILLIHRPDYLMNPEEIAETIAKLKKDGKVKYFGVSNFTTSQFDLLNSYTPLVTNQIEASILHLDPLDDGTLDQMIKHKVTPTAWSPYGGGAIFSKSDDIRIKRIQTTATKLALKHGCNMDDILLAWLLRHPSGIIPVLGTSKLSRVASAKEAAHIIMSKEEWYMLLEASRGYEVA